MSVSARYSLEKIELIAELSTVDFDERERKCERQKSLSDSFSGSGVIELVRLVSKTQKGTFGKVRIIIELVSVVSKTLKGTFSKVCVLIELVRIVLKTQ